MLKKWGASLLSCVAMCANTAILIDLYSWPDTYWFHGGLPYNPWKTVFAGIAFFSILVGGIFWGGLSIIRSRRLINKSKRFQRNLGLLVYVILQTSFLIVMIFTEFRTHIAWVNSTGGSQMLGLPLIFSISIFPTATIGAVSSILFTLLYFTQVDISNSLDTKLVG